MCQEIASHLTKDYPYNMKNEKDIWCSICDENNHNTSQCALNMENNPNYHTIYQIEAINQNQQNTRNYWNNDCNQKGGFNNHSWFNSNQGKIFGGQGRKPKCYICFNQDHLSPNCPLKDKTNLKFCTKCGVKDHSLEDCPIIIRKIMSNKNVNLLSRVPKHEILNRKNLQIVTRQGTKSGEGNQNTIKVIIIKNDYPNLSEQKEIGKYVSKIIEQLSK